MKFDMHCHTKEGSMDGKVTINDYIERLKELGFSGMLVSDHNSYNGYRNWKHEIKGIKHKDFTVLKGIEYDTIDAGHILVIMPSNSKLKILELRGLPIQFLIEIVHKNGGILGPAHPCGEKFLSITNTRKHRKMVNQLAVMEKFDFIESFNSCEPVESNAKAKKLSDLFNLPGFGGSDSHRLDCIGTAYTEFYEPIHNEEELIEYVKSGKKVTTGGTYYTGTTKEKIGAMNHLLVGSFWFYNRFGSIVRRRKRMIELAKINVMYKMRQDKHHKHVEVTQCELTDQKEKKDQEIANTELDE